jgi:transposase
VANAGVPGRPIAPLVLSPQERTYLERQVRRHRVARSLSERCRAILRCADGLPSKSVAAELGIHEHTVGKWRRRFLKDRCDGLLDEARPGRPRTIDDDQVAEVIERTLRTTPLDATHWSIRSMAAETGFSHTTIRRMWTAFACSRTAARHLNCRAIRYSSIKCAILSGFTCPHRTEPLSSASMRKARSRHSIASSRSCR